MTHDLTVQEAKITLTDPTSDGSAASTTKTTKENGPSSKHKHWEGRTFRFSPRVFAWVPTSHSAASVGSRPMTVSVLPFKAELPRGPR